ncbi:MAG: thioesterase family protein [Bacteroidota bacterium]
MITHDTHLRVRYGETDQMGYAYYGKYAEYFEVGRVELVRKLGIPYKEVEARGIMMPVSKLEVNYKRPARYDDLLTIRTIVPETPRSSFRFEYEIYNEEGTLLATGVVVLAFVNMQSMRPVRAPQFVIHAVEQYLVDQKD